MPTTFIPSIYQQIIFDWILNGQGNGIINAVAGSGKTTTLVHAARRIQSNRLLFTSFNTHIVDELRLRLPHNSTCKTIHSIGNSCINQKLKVAKCTVKESKYKSLCNAAAKQIHNNLLIEYENKLAIWGTTQNGEFPDDVPKLELIKEQINSIVSLSQLTLIEASDISQLRDLISHYTIDCPINIEDIVNDVEAILHEGERIALEENVIDYNDMVWLPYKWKLLPETYIWILVDEAQDLNRAQLHLLLKMANEETRMLFVGDPNQAIYGFAGADSQSFDNIRILTKAQDFLLSISYRCPSKVISLAKLIVPIIEEKDGAEEGEVITVSEDKIIGELRENDLVLSRATKPLVRLCTQLIAHRKQASVKGKDIGKSLVKMINEIKEVENFKFADFITFLEVYRDERINKLNAKPDTEKQILDFMDRIGSIEECFNFYNPKSIGELTGELEKLFNNDNPGIVLSTIHRAKGLEAERVFILSFDRLPLKWENQKDWQFDQEKNLKYVAITRSKRALFLVSDGPNKQ